jgi:hypothetical protein
LRGIAPCQSGQRQGSARQSVTSHGGQKATTLHRWEGISIAYINDTLNGAQDCGDRLANEWDGAEEAGLADENIEKLLVDLNELSTT